MKSILALLFCFGTSSFAHAQHFAHTLNKYSEAPNLICIYFHSDKDWISEGGAVGYTTNADTSISLASTSMNMTYPMNGKGYVGVCTSQPIAIDPQSAIVKMAAYSTAADFNMGEDCEIVGDTPNTVLSHFKTRIGPRVSSEVATSEIKMINYYMTDDEVSTWSKSGDIANKAADQKCLDLFPGSKPASSEQ